MSAKLYCSMSLLLALLPQQNCDLSRMASPEAIQEKTQQQLQPYFPNAKVIVVPQQHGILALSCAQGVSPQFVTKIAQAMVGDPSMTQSLGQLRLAPLIGGAKYSYFFLAFDSEWIRYDVDTKQIGVIPPPPAGADRYLRDCGSQQSSSATQQDNSAKPSGLYVWIGKFHIVFSDTNSAYNRLTISDSLGIYGTDQAFVDHQQAEVEARTELIRAQMATHGRTLEQIELVDVQKVPISQ